MQQALTTANYNPSGLTMEHVARLAPSVFATEPHERTSDKYKFVSTLDIVNRLTADGYQIVGAAQSVTSDPTRKNFTQHQLRFRLPRVGQWEVNDVRPEIIVTNSHDLTKRLSILAGIWRVWCSNGCAVVEAKTEFHCTHVGSIVDAIEGIHSIIQALPDVSKKILTWKETHMPLEIQREFARRALGLRWKNDDAPITPDRLLLTRRHEDRRDDVFTIYQRIEENLIQGGHRARTRNGRRRQTIRAIQSVSNDLKINKGLWLLTNEMAEKI